MRAELIQAGNSILGKIADPIFPLPRIWEATSMKDGVLGIEARALYKYVSSTFFGEENLEEEENQKL